MKSYFYCGKAIFIFLLLNLSITIFGQQESRQVSNFNSISYALPCNLTVYQDNSESLIIKGNEGQIKDIITKVVDGELKIYSDDHWNGDIEGVEIIVHLIALENLSVAGSGNVKIITLLNANDLVISLSGSGDLSCMELSGSNLEVNLAGSGDIKLGGKVKNEVEINIAGSGDVKADELECQKALVSIAGSGSASVNATESLESSIIGSGNTYYKGSPHIESSDIGSGDVKPL
jgi:hypothetical protein